MGEYTGGILEKELFGEIRDEEEKSKAELSLELKKRGENLRDYNLMVGYHQSKDLVKKMQPEKSEPTMPVTQFASRLFENVYNRLQDMGLISKNADIDDGDLVFYTAVHSRFDVLHHVDAFFEFKYMSKIYEPIRVTLDASFEDKSAYVADWLIYVEDEDCLVDEAPNGQETSLDIFVDNQAEEIARLIVDKCRQVQQGGTR